MDVVEDKTINKQFVQHAIFMLTTKHLVLFQPEGKLEFVLGDVYPIGFCQRIHPLDLFNRMSLVSLIFPISYKRAIGLVDTYDEFHDKIKQFKIKNKDWYNEPKEFGVGKLIELKYMNDEDVANINNAILQNSKDGICFRSERKCGLKFSWYVVVNCKEVQELDLKTNRDYYENIFKLYKVWKQYRLAHNQTKLTT